MDKDWAQDVEGVGCGNVDLLKRTMKQPILTKSTRSQVVTSRGESGS
jgi:hypothetical protein